MFKDEWISRILLVSFIFFYSFSAFANELAPSLLDFEANGIYAKQPGGNYVLSGQGAWTPLFHLIPVLDVRGVAAVSVFKSSLDNSKFFAPEAQVLLSYSFWKVMLEAGGGVQTWLGQSVTSPMYSIDAAWKFDEKHLGLIDRLILGYSYLTSSSAKTTEIKLGVGISF